MNGQTDVTTLIIAFRNFANFAEHCTAELDEVGGGELTNFLNFIPAFFFATVPNLSFFCSCIYGTFFLKLFYNQEFIFLYGKPGTLAKLF